MGVNISQIVPQHAIKLEALKGKKIAIDAYNELYQFLRTMPLLSDSKGRITTHLSGIFYRTTNLMSLGIKPCFVFDGPFPEIKKHKKITAPGTPRITSTLSLEMINNAKKLIEALGLPVVQAASEAEAQAAHMCAKKDVWAVASQDYDCLIFGAPRMLKNFSLAKQRKLPKGKGVVLTGTYLIELKETLKQLGISHDQLVALAMLCGTDFNPGVYGIGQKRGLELVKKHGNNFEKLFREAGWNYTHSWKEIFDCIKTVPVTNDYKLNWKKPDENAVFELLVEEHDFSEERVLNALKRATQK